VGGNATRFLTSGPEIAQRAGVKFARVKDEPGFDPDLSYQVSAHVEYFPSLVWGDPFGAFFFPSLWRMHPRFDPYCLCELPAASWIDIARCAEEIEDRLRSVHAIPADILLLAGGELGELLASTGGRRGALEGLQLTSQWLREAAGQHPTLTFYGA
jgi:hypothetical protein